MRYLVAWGLSVLATEAGFSTLRSGCSTSIGESSKSQPNQQDLIADLQFGRYPSEWPRRDSLEHSSWRLSARHAPIAGATTTRRYARRVGERRQCTSDQRLCGSNASQFWTTTIDGAFRELTTGITNRWPSADTSKPRDE